MIHFWESIFEKHEIKITHIQPEDESIEYAACNVKFNGNKGKFRVAKTTPKKIGQFVTLWKRQSNGPIEPFSISDDIDFVIVAVKKEILIGQFIFPKKILCDKGIFTDKKEGKRAFRVYPPWDFALNQQAIKSQKWQLEYFLDLNNFDTIKLENLSKNI